MKAIFCSGEYNKLLNALAWLLAVMNVTFNQLADALQGFIRGNPFFKNHKGKSLYGLLQTSSEALGLWLKKT